ncbi:hypothetical protein K933_03325 [Candidatus Halobonum tyrrellensis G22]|uniref:DUF7344 domain-containing protein n=1 Tax=Candidatus Halobonum tyrrellensis G22 TaxID=1324957 RepID=V4HFS8_9EURY|nr:hypothetical protein K933_03325 [Candidatus Halobonum tyrrellensis G22]
MESGATDTTEPGRDELFELLSNRRRRFVLHRLKQMEEGETVELSELSRQVAAWENGTDPEALSYADRKNVHTSLYQFHLPKLDDADVVDYDQRAGEVRLTDGVDEVDIYLETVDERDIPWGLYFLSLSGGAALLATAVKLHLPLVSAVSAAEWTLFIVVVFLVSSAAFAYHSRYGMRLGTEGPPPELRD